VAEALSFIRRKNMSDITPDKAPGVLTVELAWHERAKSRLAVITTTNEFISIVLDRGETLAHNDILETEDGRHTLRVCAKEESILKITAPDALSMMRLVYHLANRHVKMMITPDAVFIESDSVLHGLVSALGGRAEIVQAIFEPERGAYVHSHGHSAASSHHGHHHFDPQDYAQGQVGEELSKLAHSQS
jgi:urease accessory protein